MIINMTKNCEKSQLAFKKSPTFRFSPQFSQTPKNGNFLHLRANLDISAFSASFKLWTTKMSLPLLSQTRSRHFDFSMKTQWKRWLGRTSWARAACRTESRFVQSVIEVAIVVNVNTLYSPWRPGKTRQNNTFIWTLIQACTSTFFNN